MELKKQFFPIIGRPPKSTYDGYLYSIAGGPGGYFTTATGQVYFSKTGAASSWKLLVEKDQYGNSDKTGCEAREYPYGCVYPKVSACDSDPIPISQTVAVVMMTGTMNAGLSFRSLSSQQCPYQFVLGLG